MIWWEPGWEGDICDQGNRGLCISSQAFKNIENVHDVYSYLLLMEYILYVTVCLRLEHIMG